MSKQFNTYRVGIESMTETQLGWWEKKGVTYKPILEYNPLSKEETSRLKTEYYDNNNRVHHHQTFVFWACNLRFHEILTGTSCIKWKLTG